MRITVNTLDGHGTELEVLDSFVHADIAACLCSLFGFEAHELRLFHGLRELAGDTELSSVGATDGSELLLLVVAGWLVLTASANGTVRLWNSRSGQLWLALGPPRTGAQLRTAEFSPDGNKVLTSWSDGNLMLWSAETGKLLHEWGHDGVIPVSAPMFLPGGAHVLLHTQDNTTLQWDTESGKCTRALVKCGEQVLAFTRGGDHMLTTQDDGTRTEIQCATTGRCLYSLTGHQEPVHGGDFSPDDSLVLTYGQDLAKLWSTETGECLHTLQGHFDAVFSTLLSPDGSQVLTASADGTAKLWSASSGQCVYTMACHGGMPVVLALFSPNAERALTVSGVMTEIWITASGEHLHTLDGHSNFVESADFSPDGEQVLTCSLDGTAGVWCVASGECLHILSGHFFFLIAASFSPTRRRCRRATLMPGGSDDADALDFLSRLPTAASE